MRKKENEFDIDSKYRIRFNTKQIDLEKVKVGDKVILWNTEYITDPEVEKGGEYTITCIDLKYNIISLEEIERIYKSDNTEYEIGWEYWRFCLPWDYYN